MRAGLGLAGILLLVQPVLFAQRGGSDFTATHRVATNDGSDLRLRTDPSTKGRIITTLANGSFVEVMETGAAFRDSDGNRGNWMLVITPQGTAGWCFSAYLRPVSQSPFKATHRVVTNDGTNLRLRSRPSTSGGVLASLEYGSTVQMLQLGDSYIDADGNGGNWVYIATPEGARGWCFGGYLKPLR
jgi:SH3-like domain-containing protein